MLSGLQTDVLRGLLAAVVVVSLGAALPGAAFAGADEIVILAPNEPVVIGNVVLWPHQATAYDAGPGVPRYSQSPSFTIAGPPNRRPVMDAIHRIGNSGDWLFSLDEAANNLLGALEREAENRDIVRYDADTDTYGFFFCGEAMQWDPPHTGIDAVYLDAADNIVISLTDTTNVDGQYVEPGDLLRYRRIDDAEPSCASWELDYNPINHGLAFDASEEGEGLVTAAHNLIGADRIAGGIILAFETQTDVAPIFNTLVPGNMAMWSGLMFERYEDLKDWKIHTQINALTIAIDNCQSEVNPEQLDADGDGLGDACDPCTDPDQDGYGEEGDAGCPHPTADNCPSISNPDQQDIDEDGIGDFCDADQCADEDGDGYLLVVDAAPGQFCPGPSDCDDASAATYPGALETNDGQDNQCPGEPGHGLVDEVQNARFYGAQDPTPGYCWDAQPGATHYEVARTSGTGACMTEIVTTVCWADLDPAPGAHSFYMVRASAPFEGTWGIDSAGNPREACTTSASEIVYAKPVVSK